MKMITKVKVDNEEMDEDNEEKDDDNDEEGDQAGGQQGA